MNSKTSVSLALSAMVGVLCIGAVAIGGDLNPPAGPVNPTMKDLDDVEPRVVIRNNPDGVTPIVISGSGSYKLGENIAAIGLQHGIEISAHRVTLDLNGFEIAGAEIGSLTGIFVAPGVNDITIKNGRIRLFTELGIDATASDRFRLQNVDIINGISGGVRSGDSSVISGCTVEETGGVNSTFGIEVGRYSLVSDCIVNRSGTGFRIGTASQVSDCIAKDSVFAGFHLFDNVILDRCTAVGVVNATQYGIYHEISINGDDGALITNSSVSNFSDAGIRVGAGAVVSHNKINGNGSNISAAAVQTAGSDNEIFGNTMKRCIAMFDLGGFCSQSVYLNKGSNYASYTINDCADVAPIQNASTATNPFANR